MAPQLQRCRDGQLRGRVETTEFAGRFAGFAVRARLEDAGTTYYVLTPSDRAGFRDEALGLAFEGRYAVVTTDDTGRCLEMYVGEGVRLEYRGNALRAIDGRTFAARVDLRKDAPVVFGAGAPEFSRMR